MIKTIYMLHQFKFDLFKLRTLVQKLTLFVNYKSINYLFHNFDSIKYGNLLYINVLIL